MKVLKNNFSFDILVVDLFLLSSGNFSVIVIYTSPLNNSEKVLQGSENESVLASIRDCR